MNKKEVLEKMEKEMKKGDNASFTPQSSNQYLKAIALGIKYLIENTKEK